MGDGRLELSVHPFVLSAVEGRTICTASVSFDCVLNECGVLIGAIRLFSD